MSDANTTKAVLTRDGKVLIEQPDGSYREATGHTDWDKVNALSEEEVEAAAQADPDAPPLDDEFWRNVQVVVPSRVPKRHQGMRLDAEVLEWFKAQGPGWQTRMNAVLKSYVEARRRHGQR
jgi:uncharacterized protein (DUF4415 family)